MGLRQRPVSCRCPGIVMPGRGARPCAPTLYGNQRCITPHNFIVIPAKAGIHPPAFRYAGTKPGFWIPACAGMTVGCPE